MAIAFGKQGGISHGLTVLSGSIEMIVYIISIISIFIKMPPI